MKLHAMIAAVVAVGVAGVAFAGGQQGALEKPVTVSGWSIAGCVPPNDQAGHACDAFNQFVRANFTAREIGMLFGNRTAYPEYQTGGIDRLQKRYTDLVHAYIAQQSAAGPAAKVAAK